VHQGILSLCFVTDPLTGLSDRTKSSWVSETGRRGNYVVDAVFSHTDMTLYNVITN